MDFHATVLEVILISGVGAYIGFLIGLRSGVFLAAKRRSEKKRRAAVAHTRKAKSKEIRPSAS